MDEDFLLMPPYLMDDSGAQPESHCNRHTYGTLSFNKRRNCWVIRGEPDVLEFAKRLFPGCVCERKGEVHFSAHRRMIGDLNWLMLRYPLMVKKSDEQRWEEALRQARSYVIQREEARLMPSRVTPSGAVFHGRLTPFQEEGLAWLLQGDRCLLADEMGLGKTVQTLALLGETGGYPALIIAPPHLIRNWQSEIARFLTKEDGSPLRVHVLQGLTPYPLPEADLYLVHYLLLRGWKEALPEYTFPTVIMDEVQELRHAGTEKYSSASLISERAKRVIGLSGTPIYNHGGEIWNVINAIDFHFLGDYESFSREWCNGYGNQIVAKPALLGEKLKQEGMMLRRTKQEVLKDLPPKRRLVLPVDSDDAVFRRLMAPVQEKLYRLKYDTAVSSKEKSLLEIEVEQGERQATGIAKAPYVVQFVRALLDGGEKVLLFAHHHEVMDLYQSQLEAYRPVFITGRETPAQKENSAEQFMGGKTNLCCISLRAASGLNLQRASCVVFGELDWSPAVHSQAEDRAHRMGQTDSILCYYLVSAKGSDQDIQDALGLKVSQFVALMGDEVQEDALSSANEARQYVQNLIQRLVSEVK